MRGRVQWHQFCPSLDEARVMGEAFDAATKKIDVGSQVVYEAIAARIILAAHDGERDPIRLRDAGLGRLA
jgi:hypothetical protein